MDLLTANDRPGEYPPSYYAAAADLPAPSARAEGQLGCDVCIVGAGFTGLSAAVHLARRGYDVIVLEAQRVGFGASGRNGGQVGTGQRLDQEALESLMGRDAAVELWRLGLESVDLVRKFAADPEANVPFHSGIVHADHRKRFVPHSLAYAEKLQKDYGYDRIIGLDERAVRELVSSEAYYGGTLDMGSGHLNPLNYALGLARLARSAGVRIYEQSRVTSIDMGDTVHLSTDASKVSAKHTVLACNGYIGDLNKGVSQKVMPINNFIAATEVIPDDVRQALISNNYAVADSKFVINYFRFSDDGRLLFGGSESYGYRFPKDIAAKVRKPMLEIFPQLADVKFEQAWGGTLGITMNRLPYFDRLRGNVLTLGGYSGHGVAMATLGGKLAAEAISGQAERFDLMASIPTRGFPGGTALRSPLLVLAMIWFSLRDRL